MAYTEIPSDDEVLVALQGLGGSATAAALCDALVAAKHPRRDSQLAIQRTLERGQITVKDDLTLEVLQEEAAAA